MASNVSHAPQIKIKRRCKKTCRCVQGNETDFGHTHSGQAMRIFKQKKKKNSVHSRMQEEKAAAKLLRYTQTQ